MRFLSNPSLMPNLPQPDRWTDAEAERLYLHAMERQRDPAGGVAWNPVWCRLIEPEYLTGDVARAYGEGPHWHIQALRFPAARHSDDAQQYLRRVLVGLDATGLTIDWRDARAEREA